MDVACGTPASTVPSEHHVVRLTKDHLDYLMWSAEQGRWLLRVPGNAIQFDDDLSTYWVEHLWNVHGASADEIVEPSPGRSIAFRARIGELVALGLTVRHSPTDPVMPGCAHTSFDRPRLGPQARRALSVDISMLMSVAAGVITQLPPPGA